jgi:hypothetical protein
MITFTCRHKFVFFHVKTMKKCNTILHYPLPLSQIATRSSNLRLSVANVGVAGVTEIPVSAPTLLPSKLPILPFTLDQCDIQDAKDCPTITFLFLDIMVRF